MAETCSIRHIPRRWLFATVAFLGSADSVAIGLHAEQPGTRQPEQPAVAAQLGKASLQLSKLGKGCQELPLARPLEILICHVQASLQSLLTLSQERVLVSKKAAHNIPPVSITNTVAPTPKSITVPVPRPVLAKQRPVTPPAPTATPQVPGVAAASTVEPSGMLRRIGGCESADAPTAVIDYQAQNPISTASGGFQILDSTWGNFGGYSKARYAPPSIQIAEAEQLYGAEGTRPWISSESCWG